MGLRSGKVGGAVVISAVTLMMMSMPRGQAQSPFARRGGPRDWSHRTLLASRFGPDNDAAIARDWRTLRKQLMIQRARDARNPMADWLEAFRPRPRKDDPAIGHLDWSLRTGGTGSVLGSPAKYSFDISASSCSDVIYFTVNQNGGASTVNVIAITNAYAGCPGNTGGTTPKVKFGIRLGTGTATSAALSLDGSVLYVFESRTAASGGVILHAINVNNITSTPGTYNFASTNWTATHTLAGAPFGPANEQLFQLTFSGVTNNTSSPYVDYLGNQLFFGDSAGRIHRVTNILSSSAAEDTANFPIACGTQALESPVFVNDQIIATSADGRLYRINMAGSPPYAAIASTQAGGGTGYGVAGGLAEPVVDVTNNQVIVVSNRAAAAAVKGIGTFALMFTAGANYTSGVMVGNSDTNAPQSPALDDAFWSANNGNLYIAGTPSAGTDTQLVRVPYNGAVGTPSGYAALRRSGAASLAATSPVTEFLTALSPGNPDFIYIGGGSGTYLYMNRIASGFGGGDGSPVAMASTFAVPGGVQSGIIIDTRTTAMTGSTATANIYFGTIGVAAGNTQSTIVQLAQAF